MHVCSCNVFTDTDVKAAAGSAGGSVAAVFRYLGCRPQCGGCVLTIRKILDTVSTDFGEMHLSSTPSDFSEPALARLGAAVLPLTGLGR